VMLLNGAYRMGLRGQWAPSDQVKWMVLQQGSSYEMTHSDDMHFVDPIDFEVMSLMVTGLPFPDPPRTLPHPKQPPLTADMAERVLANFKALLKFHPGVGYHPEVFDD
jgi:hypothetical protein